MAASSESRPLRSAGRGRTALGLEQIPDDDLVSWLQIGRIHGGVSSVRDSKPYLNGLRFSVLVEEPYRASRLLPLTGGAHCSARLQIGRPESQCRVRNLEHSVDF